jgi:hypothetical protein
VEELTDTDIEEEPDQSHTAHISSMPGAALPGFPLMQEQQPVVPLPLPLPLPAQVQMQLPAQLAHSLPAVPAAGAAAVPPLFSPPPSQAPSVPALRGVPPAAAAVAALRSGSGPLSREGSGLSREEDAAGLLSSRVTDSVLASARRRLAARKQQHHAGPAHMFPPLSPPRRPPRGPAVPLVGGATPQRHGGGGAPASPGLLSPNLMSPPASARRLGRPSAGGIFDEDPDAGSVGWQQLAQSQGLDDDEAAGAETLAHMAAVYRRGSGDLEPPGSLLRRSDFITGHTPTKRSPGRRPETRISDELSPSPFKKPRSFTSTAGADLLEGIPDFRRRLAAAAAEAERGGGATEPAAPGSAPAALRSGGRRLTAKRSGARRGGSGALPFHAAAGAGAAAGSDDAMGDAGAASDSDAGGPEGSDAPIAPVGFELDAAADLIGVGCQQGVPSAATAAGAAAAGCSPPAAAGAAGGLTIAPLSTGLMSPPAPQRRGWGGSDASTPGRPVLNLLASPNFDRLGKWVRAQGAWHS